VPLRSLRELPIASARVLVRLDLNVPLRDGAVADDSRIRAALPTLEALLNAGALPIVLSHLGRPKGQVRPEYSLAPVAQRLAVLLDRPVLFVPDCIGEAVSTALQRAHPGREVVVLENVRFYPGEEANDKEFAAQLRHDAQVYINDAFGTLHRAHASVAAIADLFEWKGIGLLVERELAALERLRSAPERPYVAVIGGAKVSDKLDLLSALLERCDALLLGGAMAFTFLKAQGYAIGSSVYEPELESAAQAILQRAQALGEQLLLPTDVLITTNGDARVCTVEEGIPEGWIGYDIGPETERRFAELLRTARTIFWNGPMGKYEEERFRSGTAAVARAVAQATQRGAFTVVGGGDSIAALQALGADTAVSHCSTGGGATLAYLAGKPLPGLRALEQS
jgi:3-phosphoglycerate kinase